MKNLKAILKKELENAMEMIAWDVFRVFVYGYHNEHIGFKKYGGRIYATTLADNISDVGELINRAELTLGQNMYHSKQAFRIAEIDDPIAVSEKAWNKALKKILWLNTVCKECTGEVFIKAKIDRTNVSEVRRLVEAFEFCTLHPEMMNKAS